MKKTVLETAIVLRDWSQILDYWPQLSVSETMFPPRLRYFKVELKADLELLVYLIDSVIQEKYDLSDRIIPYIPFSLLFISQLDAVHENLWQKYAQRYQTPLFFLAPDEQELKDKIVMREDLASKLSDVLFFNPEDPLPLTWGLVIKQCLENLERNQSISDANEKSEEAASSTSAEDETEASENE